MENQPLDKKEIMKAMIFAILIAFLGIGILGWQYHRLEKRQLPLIKEKIEKQKEEIERSRAQDILDKFMLARIEKNEAQATLYLTERAMEEKLNREFTLINELESYKILKGEKLAENRYQFLVRTYRKDGDFVEAIILIKILDEYYVDSIRLAG